MNDVTIIGGGITGILLTLRLSSLEKFKNKTITLIEEQPSLGGRLFFASPRSFLEKNREQIRAELLQDAKEGKFLSGFGFELFDLQTKETLFRHIQNALTEKEKNELDNYLQKFEPTEKKITKNHCYFVKKEFTDANLLLNGSSELLTKKDSETLKTFVHTEINEKDASLLKGDLSHILSTIVGSKWDTIPFQECCAVLKQFFLNEKETFFLAFQRKVALELFLEKILLKRGVEIRNLCKLVRVEQNKKEPFSLTLNDEIEPEKKYLQTKALVLAIPLAKCAGLLPKEIYSPEQSKFISKVQPLSLVVYELSHFTELQSKTIGDETGKLLNPYDYLLFPVEKAKAFLTFDNRMLFYTELDYEDSLQAPAVREAVGRLKRAASRILKEDAVSEMKKGFRIPQNQISERVILLPVAQTVPYFAKTNFELKQVNMGVPNLYCCGESFFSLGNEPWKRIVHSVNEVVQQLI